MVESTELHSEKCSIGMAFFCVLYGYSKKSNHKYEYKDYKKQSSNKAYLIR